MTEPSAPPVRLAVEGAVATVTLDRPEGMNALTVPANRIFVLTDVIVFPLVEQSDPDFVVRYRGLSAFEQATGHDFAA